MNRMDKSVNKFKEGYNCAQSVLFAYGEDLGMSSDLAMKIATGFGGGMGRNQEVCGAVTGALMVIGLVYGRGIEESKDKQENTYSKVQTFFDSFVKEFGTVNCKELLDGCCLLTPEGQKSFKENMLIERCYDYVRFSCRILDQIGVMQGKIEEKGCGMSNLGAFRQEIAPQSKTNHNRGTF